MKTTRHLTLAATLAGAIALTVVSAKAAIIYDNNATPIDAFLQVKRAEHQLPLAPRADT